MKLAEALQERADLNRKVEQLRERLHNNALVQEGDEPAEAPEELLTELDFNIDHLEELMERINRTNCMTLDNGVSITALISKKDALLVRIKAYRELINTASCKASRAMHSEIRVISAVNVKYLQRKLDEMCRQLRETDNRIQLLNWKTDLL